MASGVAMGGTLRHLRDLFEGGTAVGLGDAQLLARYAAARDEAAFEALVARYGPMVLATCRAVLKHEHDVEDAFQATFLVLAKRARSVRAGDALGGWLHRVAYRVSTRASVQSRQRRRREAEAAATVPLHSTPGGLEPDVAAIVHEEVDRLPEKHRLPVVLCDLEGLTYEQAAGRLRWTVPTLRGRLAKARRQLHGRLSRRGVTAGTMGAVLAAQAAEAKAAVPAAMARAAVAAATGGTASTAAATLSAAIIRGLLMTRLKIVSAAVLAGFALATAGAVAVIAPRPDEPKPATPAQAPDTSKRKADGPHPPAPAGPGIEGRIVDLEGRPVAGARVAITNRWSAPDGDLGRWLDRARDRGVQYPTEGLAPGNMSVFLTASPKRSPSPASEGITTDADGRFRLAGVGPEHLVQIRLIGPTIATTDLYALGGDGAEVRAAVHQGQKPSQVVYHARRFEYAVAPTRPIQGVVRDKDTGRPLAGIALGASVFIEHNLVPAEGIEATTDRDGRYRLAGLPRAPAYRIFLEPAPGQPYPKASLRAPGDGPPFEPVTFDIALKRGIVLRGKVTDKATGQPVSVMADVYTFADNPHVREFPGYRQSPLARTFGSNDGRYEAVALPGRGIIGVATGGYKDRYRQSVGARSIKGYDPKGLGFRTYPHHCLPGNYNTLAEINLDPKAETAELDLQVDPGRAIAVTPIDPEGRPVAGTMAMGVSDLYSTSEYPQDSSTIEIVGLDPSSPRRLTVAHRGRKLIGSVYLKGAEAGPLSIRLEPWGTIVGRIVDDDGRPRGGLGLMSIGGTRPERPAEQGILPGGDVGGGVRIGRDGTFRIEGLVPGLKYGGSAWFNDGGELFRDLVIAPGEIKDLGDLKLIPPRRAN
jgi:RNA polymerase sigma factor (sigma-70 family)